MRPEVDRPDVNRPDVDRPDVDRPDIDRPDIDRSDIDRPDVDRSDVDRPDVDRSDVEIGRFANIMSAQGDHAFKRFMAVEHAPDSTAVTPRGAPPQTLYTTLLSGAAVCEAPQVGGLLQTAIADSGTSCSEVSTVSPP